MTKPEVTPNNFQTCIELICEGHKNEYRRPLEEYLRSLWAAVNKHKETEVTFALLVDLINEAFSIEPPAFNDQWLTYDRGLNWNYSEEGHVFLEALEGEQIKVTTENVDDFEILQHTLLFQIADLYRMRDNQLKDKNRYLGVVSPTGNSWYNFDVFSFLKCGVRGMRDNGGDDGGVYVCDWTVLASLLELGRSYE